MSTPRNGYAESVEREAARKMRERMAFRDASALWHTLMDDDGFTFRPGALTPDHGYMVGDGRSEVRVRTCTVETIYRFLVAHWDRFTDPNVYIGAWWDGRFFYLDVSEWFPYFLTAERTARERGEVAMWDLAAHRAIHV